MTVHSKYATGSRQGLALALGAGALLVSAAANATVIIGVEPQQQSVNVGDTVTADVRASTTEPIGSYEIDLNFDSVVLDVDSVGFSGNFGVSRADFSLTAGNVNALETTLELPSTLEQKQPDDVFSLFKVEFTAAAVGESVLGGSFQAVDPFGRVFDGRFGDGELPGGRLADARVEVIDDDDPTDVPAPSSLWLLAMGLVCGLVRRLPHRARSIPLHPNSGRQRSARSH